MKNYFEEIRKKLNQEIEIESIEIVDNSKKHRDTNFIHQKFIYISKLNHYILQSQESVLKNS